ncbi:MAG: hypothetical protein L3J39_17380 [Verrucomicrobiales bacterium]|nr:hypothetical protein [Verrucomicrobiales bacterium]
MKKSFLLFALLIGTSFALQSCCNTCAEKHKAAQAAKAAAATGGATGQAR